MLLMNSVIFFNGSTLSQILLLGFEDWNGNHVNSDDDDDDYGEGDGGYGKDKKTRLG